MQIAHRHIYCISMKKHYCLLSEMKITGLDLLRVRLFYSLKNGSSFLMKHKNKKKTISVWRGMNAINIRIESEV